MLAYRADLSPVVHGRRRLRARRGAGGQERVTRVWPAEAAGFELSYTQRVSAW